MSFLACHASWSCIFCVSEPFLALSCSKVSISICLHSKRWFAQLNVRRNWVANRLRELPKAGESNGFEIRSWGFWLPIQCSQAWISDSSAWGRGAWNHLGVSRFRYSHTPLQVLRMKISSQLLCAAKREKHQLKIFRVIYI